MRSSTYTIHLIDGLTTNESLFFSLLIANQGTKNPLQSVYMNLIPFISRVSLNKIKKSLQEKHFTTEYNKPIVDPLILPEPMRSKPQYTTTGRPSNS